ncbi:MAG TPA: TolC family protein [Melioribacteraceae bacterium]|nr:TolC family protein [Melioribacteraceae bacterium]
MKRMILAVITLLFTIPVAAQKNLTLEEAVSIALQRNTSLIKVKNSLSTSESQLKSAYGSLIPTLGANAGWSFQRINDAGSTQRDFLGNEVITPPSQIDNRSFSAGLGGSVTLFDGLANIANINQKKNNLRATEYNIEKKKQDVVYEATNFYYLVLNAEELMRVREDNVKYYQKFYETVSERNRLGIVAKADVYTAQVQLGNAELLLIQAQNSYENTISNLLNYLGLDVLEEYKLVSPFGSEEISESDAYLAEYDNINAMVGAALDTRFDFKSQQLLVQSAESGLTMARSGLFPSLSGSYSYSSGASKFDKLFDRKVLNISLSLNFPIFSNWNTENQIQFAEVNLKNAKEDLFALERQVKIEVKQGYLDLTAAKKSLDVASKNVTAAEETRKINQERYNLGSGTILEVLQADRDYTDALRNKINTSFDFYTKRDKLNNSLGKLDYKKFE